MKYSDEYEIVKCIDKNSVCEVTFVRARESNTPYIMKTILTDRGNEQVGYFKKRFRQEVGIAASFDHPNIVMPVDIHFGKEKTIIIYPYYDGKTLAAILTEYTKLNEDDALKIIKQLLEALVYVHNRGIIHADINPNTIFITEEKGLKLFDFGYSISEDEARKIPEGHIIGTFPFLSPEQMGFTGFKIDNRSDLYCVSIVLYKILGAKLPFNLPNNSIKELLDDALKRDTEVLKNVTKNLNEILLKGLRPSPVDRYQTAEGYLFDINQCIEDVKFGKINKISIGEKDALYAVSRKRQFIVRDNEIETLLTGVEHINNQKGKYYLIYGKSGIGKTEIVREFKTRIDDSKYFYLSAKCNRFTPALPYSILKQLLVDLYFRLEQSNIFVRNEFLKIIQKEFNTFSGVICSIVPELKKWFNIVSTIDKIEKEKETDRIIYVMSMLLEKICEIQKIIIVVDDFQWSDRISYNIINRVIETKIKCMIICNYRTGKNEDDLYYYSYNLRDISFTKLLKVKPFSKKETEQLVGSRFKELKNGESLINILVEKTDGIPFLVMETIRFLLSKNCLCLVGNEWVFNDSEVGQLPEKFDLLSLVVDKLKELSENEKKALEVASVIEGKFGNTVIRMVGGLSEEDVALALVNLENIGFFKTQLNGWYAFTHDKIQEAVADKISTENKCEINEKLGNFYIKTAEVEKENIFNAAEYYLKSKNYLAAINICYAAALYATEKSALDVAIKYYKNTLVISKFAEKEGVRSDLDIVKINMGYGKVLMLTGANTQALNTFQNVVNKMSLTPLQLIEARYLIGTIYNNLGEFEKSIPCYIDLLKDMGVKIPRKRTRLLLSIGIEIALQVVFSLGIKKILKKRKDMYSLLKARTLSKLTVSLYFYDMIPCFLVHFKALNLADTLEGCYEKSEIYATHMVPVYQLMFKKRAFNYLKRAITIASNIHRMDSLAYAQCVGGMTYYYNAKWNKSYELLTNSISVFQSLGDANNQVMSSEHLWKVKLMKGNMDDAYKEMNKTIELCKKVNDQSYLAITAAAIEMVSYIRSGRIDKETIKEIEDRLNSSDLVHLHIEVGECLLNLEIESDELQKAYERAEKLLPFILKKSVNSEYQVHCFALYCSLICRELRNRTKGVSKVAVHEIKLKTDFISNSFIHWCSCLSFPAYWGSFYRNSAWFMAVHHQNWLAHPLFKMAIKAHHKLDMRYEEACSIRDYGIFLDEFCNRPGEARDHFVIAYEHFKWCGVKLETDRLKGYIHSENQVSNSTTALLTEAKVLRPSTDQPSSGVNLLRFETLLDVSKTITEIDDPAILLHQILSAMITATGAQYGYLFINKSAYKDFEPIAVSFEGKQIPIADVPVFRDLIDKVNDIHTLQCTGESDLDDENETDSLYIRSDLCVPLNWRDKYLGYVYLVNDRVRGLFGEGAQKAAMVLAAHAGILLENANLISKQKQFNVELQRQVESQTDDLKQKHQQLEVANLRLIESERMKGILSGTLVHDIKNYAAGITGNLQYLDRRLENDPKAHRIIDVVCETCIDITSLASNLLDIAKMDDGKMIVREEPLGVDFFEAMAEKFGRTTLFEEKSITPRILPPIDDFTINADVYLMERVLQNLYSNASKYAPKGSVVELRLYSGNDENIVCFFNSGSPIPDSEKVILFEKYARIQSRQSPYSKGLGLFFCRMVMHAHGGRIWLDTDGEGNYFKLAFPRHYLQLKVAS